MSPWEEIIDGEDDLEPAPYHPDPDPVSVALGADWYVARHVERDCFETFPNSIIVGNPMRFDRLYPATDVRGPVLVDVLVGEGDERQREALRKHVPFKRVWCAEHQRTYLVLTEDQADDSERVRGVLEGDVAEGVRTAAETLPKRPAQRRVHRPKAATV